MNKLFRDEKGSVIVLFAIFLALILGFAALVTDFGTLYWVRSSLQNTADAAALAGAKDLYSTNSAIETAKVYAEQNGVPRTNTTVATPYKGNNTKISVLCTRTVPYGFGAVFGFTETNVSARAVAKYTSKWTGEALPFVNLADNYETNSGVVVWKSTSPGDKELINDWSTKTSAYGDKYFDVDYENGITLECGFDDGLKGLDASKLKDGLADILTPAKVGSSVYVLSLKADIIQSLLEGGTIEVTRGRTFNKDGTIKQPGTLVEVSITDTSMSLKKNDIIDKSMLVLIECKLVSYDLSNGHNIVTQYVDEYDIFSGELPPNYLDPSGIGDVNLVAP